MRHCLENSQPMRSPTTCCGSGFSVVSWLGRRARRRVHAEDKLRQLSRRAGLTVTMSLYNNVIASLYNAMSITVLPFVHPVPYDMVGTV